MTSSEPNSQFSCHGESINGNPTSGDAVVFSVEGDAKNGVENGTAVRPDTDKETFAGQRSPDNSPTEQTDDSDYADSLALGIGVVLALTIVQRGIGFLRNILFCRFLDPSELGLWNLAFSAVIFLAPFVVLGIPGVFGRYLEYYRQRGQMVTFLRRSLSVTFGLMFVGLAALLLTARYTSWFVFGDYSHVQLTVAMIAGLGFVIAFNAMIELCTALRQVRLLSYLQFANGILFAIIAIGLVCVYEASAISIMAGYAAACLITSVAAIIPLWKVVSRIEDSAEPISQRHLWTKILPFAGSLWTIAFFSNLFAAADRYMIIHFCDAGPTEATALVGQYHSSLIFPQLIVAVGTMLGSVILPYLSHDWEQGNFEAVSERINRGIRLFCVAATGAGVSVLVMAPWLFSFALADKYSLGLSVLPMTLVYCIWYGVFQIQQDYLFCMERAGQVGVAMFLGLIANVALNYLLLPILGLQGAVIATSIANAGALTYGIYWSNRRGMAVHPSTIATLILPLCLAFGGTISATVLAVFVIVGLKKQWLVDADEISAVMQKASTFTDKLTSWRRAASQA